MTVFPNLLGSGMVPTDNYFLTCGDVSNRNVIIIVTNRIFFVPIRIPTYCRVIELGINLAIANPAAQKMVMGIYDFDLKTGNPVDLLVQAIGEIPLDGTLGYKSIPLDYHLDPGIYYIALNQENIGAGSRCKGPLSFSDPILPMLTALQTVKTSHKYLDSTYNVNLPAIISSITAEGTTLNIINPILKVRTQ